VGMRQGERTACRFIAQTIGIGNPACGRLPRSSPLLYRRR
jgi:hypothetical protein